MWLGFNLFVLVLLALDLGILHRQGKEVGIREALLLSLGYFVLALIFGAGVFQILGADVGMQFFLPATCGKKFIRHDKHMMSTIADRLVGVQTH